jgi:ABC-type ATPase with predicted acetyltransferase domain
MKFNIIRESTPEPTFRVQSVIGKFDLQSDRFIQEFEGEINLPNNWQVGLIVGNSGTGKTTIAKELFNDFYITEFNWDNTKTVMDNMPLSGSVDEIVKTFNAVGFSTPMSWLKPYGVLSNGEKMRVDLARAILSDLTTIVFDEFTSVVDRNIAKIGSLAIQKAVRKTDKKFIAVGCHFDVEEWLQPDWVFNTNTMEFYEPEKKSPNFSMNYSKQWINQFGKSLVNIII